MNPTLYIIATPIGNINEISKRAIEIIDKSFNFFCEDTRVFKKLLTVLEIKKTNKSFFSLNNFNEKKVVDNFQFKNEVYCLVSDAGYPLMSDPGFYLINHFKKNNWNISVINGPCSIIHALVASGFKTNDFSFYGFLPNTKSLRIEQLNKLKNDFKTIVFFEAVHRIIDCLKDIKNIFGNDVKICVCRELTKLNETIYIDNIESIIEKIVIKGEFVIVIDNNVNLKTQNENVDFTSCLFEIKKLVAKGEKDKTACKMVGYKHSLKSRELYAFWQLKKNNI